MLSRQYQTDLKNGVYKAWDDGHQNVLGVLPTGGGKTWVFSEIIAEHKGQAVAIAHRREIISQMSLSLATHGVRHRVIGPDNVIKMINRLHMTELRKSFYHPSAKVAVASVDTLIARREKLNGWCNQITLVVTDEAHHLLKSNKWGRALTMFPRAKGLGVTATPCRADGKGLGVHADGVFSTMVEGPQMRYLIDNGFLSQYRVFAPLSDIDLSTVNTGANGDYTKPSLKAAVAKSQVVGDVVAHYRRIAPGKLGVTFATDVETAGNIADHFNAAGVPAAVLRAKTPDNERIKIMRDFRNRKLLQLVNVDILSEGVDVPAVEVVSMARPTKSFSLFAQQFGRALRPSPGKEHAIIIDHVGNVIHHGLPDAHRVWALDRRERVSRGTPPAVIPVKACPQCTAVYERIYAECPYCGFKPKPMARSGPDLVDGDLSELSPEVLAAMRGNVVDVGLTPQEYLAQSGAGNLPHVAAMSAAKQFRRKQEAQLDLRGTMALWAGYQRAAGRPDSESYRRFYHAFGTDVLSAQALGRREAVELKQAIDRVITNEY